MWICFANSLQILLMVWVREQEEELRLTCELWVVYSLYLE